MPNRFCIAPWIHIYLSTEGDVLPCCASLDVNNPNRFGLINNAAVEEIFNSDAMKQLRVDMLNNVDRPDICKECYDIESSGFRSIRNGFNETYKNEIEEITRATLQDGSVDPKIISWDLRYSNLCNLKCRTCSSFFSSSIAHEEGAATIKIQAIKNDKIDPFENQYHHVQNIYFAGGEPLINYEHFRTIKKLVDRGYASNVSLSYNTNCTKLDYDSNSLVELWKKFKMVSVGVSIDAVETRAEYIRHGVSWSTIESNLKTLMELKYNRHNFHFFYSVTVSALNVAHLTDMHRYLWENNLIPHTNDIQFNLLMSPFYYSCKIIPISIRINIIKKIDDHIIWLTNLLEDNNNDSGVSNAVEEFLKIKNFLQIEDCDHANLKQFIIEIKNKDLIRKENFFKTFPEYKDIIWT